METTSSLKVRVEKIQSTESFPQSTAICPKIRRQLERGHHVHPWDADETLAELHRRKYYPRGSKLVENDTSVKRWPNVLRAVVEGKAELALSSFGAALYYLQRNLIDAEILSSTYVFGGWYRNDGCS